MSLIPHYLLPAKAENLSVNLRTKIKGTIKKIVGNPGRTAYLEFLFQRFTVSETIRISDNSTLS